MPLRDCVELRNAIGYGVIWMTSYGNSGSTAEMYFAGVDGGQSGTRCLIMRGNGTACGFGRSRKVDFLLSPGGRERVTSAIREAAEAAMKTSGTVPIYAAFLGLSGIVPGGALEQAAIQAGRDALGVQHVFADCDGVSAWAGALSLRPGIIVIAGSGSLVLGVDGRGVSRRAGGWGYLFGDEAGAFGIAVAAIKAALQDYDAGRESSPLIDAVKHHFREVDVGPVVKKFYAGLIDRTHVASFAPKLADMARTGVEDAVRVFTHAGTVVARQMVQVASRLVWESSEIEWAPVGGVFRSGMVIIRPIQDEISRISAYRFKMTWPELPPAAGAALLAYAKTLGNVPESVIAELKDSIHSIPEVY